MNGVQEYVPGKARDLRRVKEEREAGALKESVPRFIENTGNEIYQSSDDEKGTVYSPLFFALSNCLVKGK